MEQIDSSSQPAKNLDPPVALKAPNKKVTDALLKSTSGMGVVTEFLTVHKMIQLQLVSKNFYESVIPNVMNQRHMFPSVDPAMHLYIHNQCLWGIKLPSKSMTREVDFEEDEWIHDNQHVLDDKGHQWPEKLIDFK